MMQITTGQSDSLLVTSGQSDSDQWSVSPLLVPLFSSRQHLSNDEILRISPGLLSVLCTANDMHTRTVFTRHCLFRLCVFLYFLVKVQFAYVRLVFCVFKLHHSNS